MEAARHLFTLERPNEKGVTLRSELHQVWRTTGKRPAFLDCPEPPPQASHVLAWFLELNQGRGSSGFGPLPLGWSEIEAWARLTGKELRPQEVALLKRLDSTYLTVFTTKGATDGN